MHLVALLSGVGGFEGSRGVRALVTGGCIAPHPHTQYEKIHIGFLRFAWTPLGSSGGSRPLDPPGQLRRCSSRPSSWIKRKAKWERSGKEEGRENRGKEEGKGDKERGGPQFLKYTDTH